WRPSLAMRHGASFVAAPVASASTCPIVWKTCGTTSGEVRGRAKRSCGRASTSREMRGAARVRRRQPSVRCRSVEFGQLLSRLLLVELVVVFGDRSVDYCLELLARFVAIAGLVAVAINFCEVQSVDDALGINGH